MGSHAIRMLFAAVRCWCANRAHQRHMSRPELWSHNHGVSLADALALWPVLLDKAIGFVRQHAFFTPHSLLAHSFPHGADSRYCTRGLLSMGSDSLSWCRFLGLYITHVTYLLRYLHVPLRLRERQQTLESGQGS